LRFSYFTTDNGLSNNIVNCIEQDNQNYIWIGTAEGLNRYDGYGNKIFKKVLGDTTSLADNMIYNICIDYLNNIWIGTENGICLFNYDKENFKTFLLDSAKYKMNLTNRITGIKEDAEKRLYVTTENGYLYSYNRKNGSFEKDNHNFTNIKCFIISKHNQFWLGGINGLYFYDKNSGKVIYFNSFTQENDKYSLGAIKTILEEGDTIWIGTSKGQLYYFLKHNLQINMLDCKFENTYYISDIFKDRGGLLYISTASGIFIYNKAINKYIQYKYQQNNPTGLNCLDVTKVYEDKQGNIWVGTFQGGINLAIKGKKFYNYDYCSKEFSLSVVNIHAICEDSKGNLWLGSFNNGINVINPTTGENKLFINDGKNPYSLSLGSVYSIFEDSKKNIWVGTYMGYLQRFDPVTEKFISYSLYPENKNNKGNTDVRSIIEDKNENLWFLSHGFGMIKYNTVTKKFKCFRRNDNNINSSLANDWSFQLLLDHENFIWIASPSGLSKFNPQTETFQNYYHNPNDSNSLCNNYVNMLFEDSNKNLWIGTSYGLDLLNRKESKFVHFSEKNGLPNNQIKSILENKPGELWISTNFGLSRMVYGVDTKTGVLHAQFRNYNKWDNLQDNFFWERSACKTKNGKLAFGCVKGIIMFKPDEIKDDTIIPEVYITGFKLFNKPVAIGEYDSLLKHSISRTSEIRLKHNQNIFSFDFVAINYISRENNQYAYKMDGFDRDWNYVGTKHEAIYTNLDPGKYVFRVKASNNDRYWNEKGASIKLTILPPFWKTWWFRLLIVLCILSLSFSYYFFRINILKNRTIILEKNVEERTRLLSKANDELIEKNNWILSQNEEITSQNQEIYNKNEEISSQKELLEEQKSKVEKAYEELSQYRNKLEDLVEKRTTELNAAKQKAEESDKLKSSFLANLSHEIRTPLNSIIGFSSLICDPSITEEELQKYKSIIESSSNALLNLISDIIDFSKIEAGHMDVNLKEVPLYKIINEIQQIFSLEIKKQQFGAAYKHLKLIVNIDEKIMLLTLVTDEIKIKQILSNLISNAIKFTEKGYIEIGCNILNDNQMLEFSVKDTGIGIKKEDQEIIFQRFRKIEDDKSNIYRGAGLGLTISMHLVTLLKGQIRVESNVGKGSVFYFTIPLKESVKKNSVKQNVILSQTIPDFKNILILVAEDDISNYFYIEKLLQKTKAKIIHAVNGKQVIQMFQDYPEIKLILMDIKMPDTNGIETLLELKKYQIKIPVIAQTAYAFSDEINTIFEAGFDDYITKPISSNALYYLLKKHLKNIT
jgi:signal transduction histidine kinase/ligand-binding sensor domain-containing protein/CheY-like chemotaxis protein